MAVIVVGDIDPAVAEQKIKAHFGSYKKPANAKIRPNIIPIKPRTKPEAMVLTDDENGQTILQIIHNITPAKKIKTWSDYREDLVKNLVNNLINQRLQELTQKENPPFVFGFTGEESFIRGYDAVVSVALLGENTTKVALDALLAETERFSSYGD